MGGGCVFKQERCVVQIGRPIFDDGGRSVTKNEPILLGCGGKCADGYCRIYGMKPAQFTVDECANIGTEG